jgi:acetyltransferase-like isoleucine patch superfamily enzyme
MRRLLFFRDRPRWWKVVLMLRLRALVAGADLTVDIAPDVRFGKRFKVSVGPGKSTLRLGPGVQMQDDVTIHLGGGTIDVGPRSSIRQGSIIHVDGDLILEGENIISYYNVIHCSDRIRLHRLASTNEFVTIVDSRHFHDDTDRFFYENVESAPIEVGENVWMANKSSILMGVTVGEKSIVAAHAVVHKDVPARSVVGGIPARVIRQS